MMLDGLPVIVSMALPIVPSDAENTVRSVRHGLADVLEWLGEDVGPRPGAEMHAVQTPTAIFVSRECFDELKNHHGYGPLLHGSAAHPTTRPTSQTGLAP